MLKIYHVSGTRSVRPIWLCYELEVPVEIEPVDFSPEFRSTPEWRAISPAGKVPVLVDGTVTMFESGAMVDYILAAYGEGRLRPRVGTAEYAIHQQWCWFSEATLIRPLGLSSLVQGAAGRDVAAEGREKVQSALGAVDEALRDRDFLLGSQFSAADVMMGYSLGLLERFDALGDAHEDARAYLARLRTRDACQRAISA